MKNELVAAKVQCWGRSDRSGSSSALLFSLPISRLELDLTRTRTGWTRTITRWTRGILSTWMMLMQKLDLQTQRANTRFKRYGVPADLTLLSAKVVTRILWSRQQRCARMPWPVGIHTELENTPSLSRRIPKNS